MLTSGTVEFGGLMQVCVKLKFIPPPQISHGEEVEADLRHADRCVWDLFIRHPPAPQTEHMDTVTPT